MPSKGQPCSAGQEAKNTLYELSQEEVAEGGLQRCQMSYTVDTGMKFEKNHVRVKI